MRHYSKKVPTLISNTVSNADELSRWILDWNGIDYIDERHAPGLHIKPANKAAGVADGIANNPVLVTTDAIVSQKDGVFNYLEARCAPDKSLLPGDPDRREQAEALFKYFWDELWRPVGRYVYAKILPHRRVTVPLMRERVPLLEKVIVTLFYRFLAKAIADGLELDKYRPDGELDKIKRVFARVEELLSDGRRYLTGDTLTVADMMFAVNSAPVILPPEFGGAIGKIQDLPDDLRRQIKQFQDSEAGRFAARLYREHRPPGCDQTQLPQELGFFGRVKDWFARLLFNQKLLVWLYSFSARKLPMFRFGKRVFVNRHELVTDVLTSDEAFTIEEINKHKMAKLSVTFFLGMDRSTLHEREFAMTRGVIRDGDSERIREFVRAAAQEQIELAREFKRIDVVSSLTKVVMVRLLRDYFGVGGPSEAAMKRWMERLFWDLFLNQGNDEAVHERAYRAAEQVKGLLEGIIAKRKQALRRDPDALEDNLLNRMLREQRDPDNRWLSDDVVRRNISGLIIGALSTNSKAVVLVLDELLRRPTQLERATQAAVAGDVETVHHYAFEALRFNPHNPVILRFAEQQRSLTDSGEKCYKVKAKSQLYVSLSSAMFDPEQFPHPKRFDAERDLSSYMHFGYGFHRCYGSYINGITIPELTMAVLRLKDLRRAPCRAGNVVYEGPFPNNFLLTFG